MNNKTNTAKVAKRLSDERLTYLAYSYVEWQRVHEAATDPRKVRGVIAYLARLSACAFTDVPEIARFQKVAWNLVRRTERVNGK